MLDRVPVNPGRVLITPENGSAAYYATMTRADNPTQEGTPLNKASLLKDTTATLFGLGAAAVPDDVFAVLSRFQNGLGNEYVWEKGRYETELKASGFIDDDVVNSASGPASTQQIIYDDNPEFTNPTTINVSYNTYALADVLAGKFFKKPYSSTTRIYYGDPNGKASQKTQGSYYKVMFSATTTYEFVTKFVGSGYVSSSDPNAYPVNDGFTYLGPWTVGSGKTAKGSYVGTGTYGSSNKNSLTFDFEPRVVIFDGAGLAFTPYPYVWGSKKIYHSNSSGSKDYNDVTINGNTMSWYNTSNAINQFNDSGKTYNWVAIG